MNGENRSWGKILLGILLLIIVVSGYFAYHHITGLISGVDDQVANLRNDPFGHLADQMTRNAEIAMNWTGQLITTDAICRAMNDSPAERNLSQDVFANFHKIVGGGRGYNYVTLYKILLKAFSNGYTLEFLGEVFNATAPTAFRLLPEEQQARAILEAKTWLYNLSLLKDGKEVENGYYGDMVKKWHERTGDDWIATAAKLCNDFIAKMEVTAQGPSVISSPTSNQLPTPTSSNSSAITTDTGTDDNSPKPHAAPRKATKKLNF